MSTQEPGRVSEDRPIVYHHENDKNNENSDSDDYTPDTAHKKDRRQSICAELVVDPQLDVSDFKKNKNEEKRIFEALALFLCPYKILRWCVHALHI